MGCDHTTKDCHCCPEPQQDPVQYNRPGLPAIKYRIGAYGNFFQRMLGKLHQRVVLDPVTPIGPDGTLNLVDTPLQQLTTREPDDHTIALLDAWAVTSDVLTFYQERIANEGYLRTATERRSVLELAGEIGYQLNPGVAAETDLAFTVEEVTDATTASGITLPDRFVIPKGTQVLSMPQGDELPQTFETLEEFEARPGWNSMRPRMSWDQDSAMNTKRIWLLGTSLNIKPGARVLLVPRGAGASVIRVVGSVDEPEGPNGDKKLTEIVFVDSATNEPSHPVDHTLTPFDVISPDDFADALTRSALDDLFALMLTEADLQAFLAQKGWSGREVLQYANRENELSTGQFEVHVFREKSGVLGCNAVHYDLLPEELRGNYYDWFGGERWSVWMDTVVPLVEPPSGTGIVIMTTAYIANEMDPDYGASGYGSPELYLERVIDKVVAGGYLVLERSDAREAFLISSAIEQSRNAFASTVRTTGVVLYGVNANSRKSDGFFIRNTTVHSASETITLARRPDQSQLGPSTSRVDLDTMVLGLSIGQPILITGERADAENINAAERHTLAGIYHYGGRTILVLTEELAYSYVRSTVRIMANVVRASHGESITQVIGSGDGAAGHQYFTLSKSKLTYVQADTPSGGKSTLTVRVDGVAWTGVPSLYDRASTDKVCITRIDDDAKATVRFGDGKMGARLPSGQINITAEYRSGTGLEGEVAASTLTLLKSKPYGVKAVTNPIEAGGAEDPEELANARENAPLTVRTLDRVVSLYDYEDYTAAYLGIGKAMAVELWDGNQELVHISVLDSSGDPVIGNQVDLLRSSLEKYRDRNRRFIVQNADNNSFSLVANVRIDPAYVWEDVQSDLLTALTEAFSFEERSFGQHVSKAEILELMHRYAAVVSIDVDFLYIDIEGGSPTLSEVLTSRIAAYRTTANAQGHYTDPAALLTINPYGITLNRMSDEA